MFKVRFAAKVRNTDIQEVWTGFYDPAQPFQLRSNMADVPVFKFATEDEAKAFIAEQLPTIDAETLEVQSSRFKAPRAYDEASGEYWTRTALMARD